EGLLVLAGLGKELRGIILGPGVHRTAGWFVEDLFESIESLPVAAEIAVADARVVVAARTFRHHAGIGGEALVKWGGEGVFSLRVVVVCQRVSRGGCPFAIRKAGEQGVEAALAVLRLPALVVTVAEIIIGHLGIRV